MSTGNLLPICFTCARFRGVKPGVGYVCDAFGNKPIPVDIMASRVDHAVSAVKGDHGLRYMTKSLAFHEPIHGDDVSGKLRKADVGFEHPAKGDECCAECAHFRGDSCEIVAGAVAPEDWCERFLADQLTGGLNGMAKLALDPSESEAQRRAMWAAAGGNSTLGIPQSVGKEFAEADPGGKLPARAKDAGGMEFLRGAKAFLRNLIDWVREEEGESEHAQDAPAKGRAASVAFVTQDGHVLLLKRHADDKNWPGHWAFPGGKVDDDETEEEGARREATEECGEDCSFDGMIAYDKVRTPGGWDHTTFVVPCDERFEPTLSKEHSGYHWAALDNPPLPVHPAVENTMRDLAEDCMAGDMFNESDHPRDPSGKFGSGGTHEHRMHELSERKLDEEIEKANKRSSASASALINAGRGNEKYSETAEKAKTGDPLAQEHVRATAEQRALYGHRDYRRSHGEKFVREQGRKNLERLRSAQDESASTREHNEGKLSQGTRSEIGRAGSEHREDMPGSAFLEPGTKKYPVKEERDGKWQYTRNLLLAAARRARMEHREDLAKRADEIREREFGAKTEDEWSDAAREAAAKARAAHSHSGSVNHLAEAKRHSSHAKYYKWASNPTQAKFHREAVTAHNNAHRMQSENHPDYPAAARKAAEATVKAGWGPPGRDSGILTSVPDRAHDSYAMDRDPTNRTTDADGRLHVKTSHISKATVNPYYGSEIPDYERLGLDPEKRYMLLRHPDELKKAASTFNNLPLLSKHVPVSAEKPENSLIIGSTGTDAKFNAPYLDNSLVFWPKDAIDKIEDGDECQLSCAYRYTPDMTPGTWEGRPYDGVMRDIVGNHVALVKEGRAGPDVMVGDSAEGMLMLDLVKLARRPAVKTALSALLSNPQVAQDAEVKHFVRMALDATLEGSSAIPVKEADDPEEHSPGMDEEEWEDEEEEAEDRRRAEDARKALGRDETEEECEEREKAERAEDARRALGRDETDEERKEREEAEDARRHARDMRRHARDAYRHARDMMRRADDRCRAMDARRRLGRDETPEEMKEREGREAEDRSKRAADRRAARDAMRRREADDRHPRDADDRRPRRDADDRHARRDADDRHPRAMDAASVQRLVDERVRNAVNIQQGIREAERFVQPWIGTINNVAFDSADAVYAQALRMVGVDTEGVHPSAFKRLLEAQPKPGGARRVFAADAAAGGGIPSLDDMFGTGRIGRA